MELVGYEDDETRSSTSFSLWVVHVLSYQEGTITENNIIICSIVRERKYKNNKPHYGEIYFDNDCFIVEEKEEVNETEWNVLCKMFGLIPDKTNRIVIKGKVEYFGMEV